MFVLRAFADFNYILFESLTDICAGNLIGDLIYVYNNTLKMNAFYSLTPDVATLSVAEKSRFVSVG
jgi:hypothetical protein